MITTTSSNDSLYSIWYSFVNSGEVCNDAVDDFLVDSWQRSLIAGVDPYAPCTNKLDVETLTDVTNELISVAHPIMVEIHKSFKGSRFRVCLVNENGIVIHSIPEIDASFNINWNEQIVGTNAIGTAIVTGQSVQIHGAEHYCYHFHNLTTTAAPMFYSNGNLLAVLALIGWAEEDQSHVLTMLVKAAEKMIDHLKLLNKNRQIAALNHRISSIFNTTSDGIIIFEANGTINFVNPALESILGKHSDEIIGTPLQNLFQGKKNFIEQFLTNGRRFSDVQLVLKVADDTIHFLAAGEVSRDKNGIIHSGMVVLHNMDTVHCVTSRFSGARARYTFENIIGKSEVFLDSLDLARMAARNNSNVLLQGESGTGKDVLAQAIHNASSRRRGNLVAINCGAIPRELIASELFGYVDGAFTGAKKGGSIGKFELASGGTIFLDEIGDMPAELQVALLRVLQNKCITRIGDVKEIPVDVRVICATNKNLIQEIEKGRFREDLYYRLNVISINIPPLRHRREDIPLFIKCFLGQLVRNNENLSILLEPEIMNYLITYDWPGNVRQLNNVIERLICISDQRRITVNDLPADIISPHTSSPRPTIEISLCSHSHMAYKQRKLQKLAQEEYNIIIDLLKTHRGNVTQVALDMGVSRMTLYRKMKLYNISKNDV